MAVTDPVGAGLAAPKQTAITDLLDEALSLWRSDPVAARACIVRARALTGSTGSDGDGASSPVGVGAPLTWRARQIAEFVDANIGRIIYSAELAGAAKMSTGQLARALKATFGVSPSEYVMHRRLALAQRLMLETNDALAQIAEVCGLCDQAHLSRAFRKTFGQTPAAWRREHRGLGRPLSVQPQAFADQLPDGPGTAL
ncbi:AraC family transcriptional regulator [Caulobacter sp.]|uniref:helix-turn-helix domain-containing protein n=1 Tax=Caulobacter sp. TaxID=78 RepID=UPI002B47B8E8|nr:AraC family transcriptional regulator [Caulobacter sp.]HJV40883.1 AraC family transcriptional regulator [Caulobacter sp.]